MKKNITALFLIITCFAFGQLKKGNYVTGGSLLVHPSKETNISGALSPITKTLDLNISPRLGIFISDKIALGVELGYSYLKNEFNYPNTNGYYVTNSSSKSSSFTVQPFFRNYIPVSEKISFFTHSTAGISFGVRNIEYLFLDPNDGRVLTQKYKYDAFSGAISLSPGIAFFISPKWSAEATFASLGYRFSNNKPQSGDTAKSYDFIFNYGFSAFNFGVAYYINR